MTSLILIVLLLLVLGVTALVAYRAGLDRGARDAGASALSRGRELHGVLRAARRAAGADPSMPTDAALRQQELTLALDEYDLTRDQLE